MTIEASFNEVESLVLKAARGAGLSWGLAEEASRAARWLAAFGLPWSGTLLRLLGEGSGGSIALAETPDGGELSATGGGALFPLLCGPHLVDCAGLLSSGAVTMKQAASPLWLLPHAAQAAEVIAEPVELACAGTRLVVTRRSCSMAQGSVDMLTDAIADVRCRAVVADAALEGRPAIARAVVDEAHWNALEAFAARTYVPASELSRVAGAGAGGADND